MPFAKLAKMMREPEGLADVGSVRERVEMLAPWINEQLANFHEGKVTTGVRTFQAEILKAIKDADLSEDMYYDISKVGVHPDNREGCMVVPIDVHDLLVRIVGDGWDESLVDALACKMPPSLAATWRAKNVALTENACGLLAPCVPDLLEIVTARGSHTTQAAKVVASGATSVYDDKFSHNGKISKRMILEQQPSMAIPLEKGIKYTVLRHELVEQCPLLMSFLSQTGNASHGVHRKQTAVQGLKRIHDLAAAKLRAKEEIDWNGIAKIAALGMGTNYAQKADSFRLFVQRWSGGSTGALISDIADFEQTLRTKREIALADLRALANVELAEAPRYIAAVVKAMLSAPPSAVSAEGEPQLFNAADYQAIAAPNGKLRPFAIQAAKHMKTARDFIDAYSNLGQGARVRLLSDMEVRMVTHVHQKRCDTRRSFKSILHIMQAMYDEAQAESKALGRTLPDWPVLAGLAREGDDTLAASSASMRELDMDGAITDQVFRRAGFGDGVLVVSKSPDEREGTFKVTRCDEQEVVLTRVDVTRVDAEQEVVSRKRLGNKSGQKDAEDEAGSDLRVSRAELLSSWLVKREKQVEVAPFTYTASRSATIRTSIGLPESFGPLRLWYHDQFAV